MHVLCLGWGWLKCNSGQFVQKGQPVATVASGDWLVRVLLSEEELTDAHPAVGDAIEVRSMAVPGRLSCSMGPPAA